ncbi:MAG: hypothetical protein IJL85_00360 [Erysipelotrichaceae bacterium]|nr:hypothetical protein [Erysipelotrichaceae bacterium]
MKYLYVVNRFYFKEKTDEIIKTLEKVSLEFGRDFEILVNDTIGDALLNKEMFKDRECIVTALGGDGSVNRILNNIVDTKNILSYIPIGTGNDFYRGNLEVLENGIHDVDLIRINDTWCINIACFGIDADIANDDRFIHNKLIPESMRYNAAVVYHFLTYNGRRMKISCNDEVYDRDYTTVVVANSRYYGSGYKVSPFSEIDDGMMEVYLVDRLNKANMAKVILSMKDASHLKNPAVKALQTDRLVISADTPFTANIDGELLTADRFEIQIIPKKVRLDFDTDFIKKVREVKYS